MYYYKNNGQIQLTPEGQYILDYFGLSLQDLKQMSKDQLIAYTKRFSDVLNDGKIRQKTGRPNSMDKVYEVKGNVYGKYNATTKYKNSCHLDEGTFSRYFSLDSWTEKTLPFLIVPKASKSREE